jgi:hypothetical protein
VYQRQFVWLLVAVIAGPGKYRRDFRWHSGSRCQCLRRIDGWIYVARRRELQADENHSYHDSNPLQRRAQETWRLSLPNSASARHLIERRDQT